MSGSGNQVQVEVLAGIPGRRLQTEKWREEVEAALAHLRPLPPELPVTEIPVRVTEAQEQAALERATLDNGGRVYLAKDSALSPEGFAAMYPELDRQRKVLAETDPQARFQSDLSRRLGMREATP